MKNTREEMVKKVSMGISNPSYNNNEQATEQLMELLDKVTTSLRHKKPMTAEDYINIYDESFYTYQSWDALVCSEAEQNEGMTAKECNDAINHIIWQLPCGWFVQYV